MPCWHKKRILKLEGALPPFFCAIYIRYKNTIKMKHFIVTGASRGVGREVVLSLARSVPDSKIIALARSSDALNALRADVGEMANGSEVCSLPFDLLESDTELLKECIEKFLHGRVDGLLNNAGRLIHKSFTELSDEDWMEVYKVNVIGVSKLTRLVLPYMKEGHVVMVSSMGGIMGSVKFAGLSAYSSSKAAVIGMVECLAEEYKEGLVRFNALAFGSVQTEMLEEAFPGFKAAVTAEEMGVYTADFLLNGGRYYNGKTLQVSSSTP